MPSPNDYFGIYVETIQEGLRKIKKLGFKRMVLIKEIMENVEVLLLALGSRSVKVYGVAIQTIQKLMAANFIAITEDLSGAVRLLKEDSRDIVLRELLLVPPEWLEQRTFKEIYLETLLLLPEREEGLQFVVVKAFGLVWRVSQTGIPRDLLRRTFDYALDAILVMRPEEDTHLLKSALLEIVRHALESYRETQELKFLMDGNNISIRSTVHKYGHVLADTVALQLEAGPGYVVIPHEETVLNALFPFTSCNQSGQRSGKFGWCINCRNPANFYCLQSRFPVCSYACKQSSNYEFAALDRFLTDELRASAVFERHLITLIRLFAKYFRHPDTRRRTIFAELFVFIASELKKMAVLIAAEPMLHELRELMRDVLGNICRETEAFSASMLSFNKLIYIRSFADESEALLEVFAGKLVNFQTPVAVKEEILKMSRDLINTRMIFDLAMEFDCKAGRNDSVEELLRAVRQLYVGVVPPEGVVLAAEDPVLKKHALETMLEFFKALQGIADKKMNDTKREQVEAAKGRKNVFRNCIDKFNKATKPQKVLQEWKNQKMIEGSPRSVAQFVLKHLKQMSLVNVGVLIGGGDEMSRAVRDEFFAGIAMDGVDVDEALRVLLRHFTMPGESQVVERIVESFAGAFLRQNSPHPVFRDATSVFSFSYLLMMLQTNLHNPQVLEKMTLKEFSNLSKNMNGPASEFPPDFLERIYKSIEKTQLGFHSKLKETELVTAYKENSKRAHDLYLKQIDKEFRELNVRLKACADVKSTHETSLEKEESSYPEAIKFTKATQEIANKNEFETKDNHIKNIETNEKNGNKKNFNKENLNQEMEIKDVEEEGKLVLEGGGESILFTKEGGESIILPKEGESVIHRNKNISFDQEEKEGKNRILNYSAYPVEVFLQSYIGFVVQCLMWKVHELDEREELVRTLDQIEILMRFSCEKGVREGIKEALITIWSEISLINTQKKFLLLESFVEWVKTYNELLFEQWDIVINLLSQFQRSKCLKKEAPRNQIINVVQGVCYIYEPLPDFLFGSSVKYTIYNLQCLLMALISVSRQEISENANPYCLEKLHKVLETNEIRFQEVLSIIWIDLREHYVELGKSKIERIALFGMDFLKQFLTKLLKKKDFFATQREYFKPIEDIFYASKLFGVKEDILGAIVYFINNHATVLRGAWKVILNVVSAAFDEGKEHKIKEKAYVIIRKLVESNYSIFPLEEYGSDFVQILGKLARESEAIYPSGCLEAVNALVEYYDNKHKLSLMLEHKNKGENEDVDVSFWQTIFLPLLSSMYGICGDSRAEVQEFAVHSLFAILLKYGALFPYEFWKMVLQGVLRPAFEEITYAPQSKQEEWFKKSFELLFAAINNLICTHYDHFRLFLGDVFKIYESCILHSVKLLIKLSLDALLELLAEVAPRFELYEWEAYVSFTDSVFKKAQPNEITSLANWHRAKDSADTHSEAKCFALHLFISSTQIIIEKYPTSLTLDLYRTILAQIHRVKSLVIKFNRDFSLRETLWKEGFYRELKILPGLIYHELELYRSESKILARMMELTEENAPDYFKFVFEMIKQYNECEIKEQPRILTQTNVEMERLSHIFLTLFLENVFPQLENPATKALSLTTYRGELFKHFFGLVTQRNYCARCLFCEACEEQKGKREQFSAKLKQMIFDLFRF